MSLTDQLMADYNHYRAYTHSVVAVEQAKKIRLPPLRPTPERLGKLRDMALFCIEHGSDPRIWLYSLFSARQWLYPPPLDHLTPKSHMERYRKIHKLGFFERRLAGERQRRRAGTLADYDPNRDLSPSIEVVKAGYLRTGRPDACMAGMAVETLGFHPRSDVCRQCPVHQACAQALRDQVPFDILALRRGELTAQQAQQACRTHYDNMMTPENAPHARRL